MGVRRGDEAAYELVIRSGTIYDGSGGVPVVGDIAVIGDSIAAVGTVKGSSCEEFDASGHLVTPGFFDIHTHMMVSSPGTTS